MLHFFCPHRTYLSSSAFCFTSRKLTSSARHFRTIFDSVANLRYYSFLRGLSKCHASSVFSKIKKPPRCSCSDRGRKPHVQDVHPSTAFSPPRMPSSFYHIATDNRSTTGSTYHVESQIANMNSNVTPLWSAAYSSQSLSKCIL